LLEGDWHFDDQVFGDRQLELFFVFVDPGKDLCVSELRLVEQVIRVAEPKTLFEYFMRVAGEMVTAKQCLFQIDALLEHLLSVSVIDLPPTSWSAFHDERALHRPR
jgi:hypothetical protein